VFGLVNLCSLLVYIEHNGDESPKDAESSIDVKLAVPQKVGNFMTS